MSGSHFLPHFPESAALLFTVAGSTALQKEKKKKKEKNQKKEPPEQNPLRDNHTVYSSAEETGNPLLLIPNAKSLSWSFFHPSCPPFPSLTLPFCTAHISLTLSRATIVCIVAVQARAERWAGLGFWLAS